MIKRHSTSRIILRNAIDKIGILFVFVWTVTGLSARTEAQDPRPSQPLHRPRNVLHLPTVPDSQKSSEDKPVSLPPTGGNFRLSSSLNESSPEKPEDKASQGQSTSSDRWERITPLPIDANDNFDQQWLRENGGEAIPRKRELYNLRNEASQPRHDEPSKAAPSESSNFSGSPEYASPYRQPPLPGSRVNPAEQTNAPNHARRESNDPESLARMHNWSGFPSLMPNLSQELNYIQASSSSYSPNSSSEHAPLASQGIHAGSPNCEAIPPCDLRHRVDQRLFASQFAGTSGCSTPFHPEDFRPLATPACPPNPAQELETYYGKKCVPTQRPLVELWRPFYGDGIFSPAIPVFSDVNPLMPQFILYGDYRAGVGIHRNNGDVRSIANRLALDMDLRLTGTERIHGFMAPLDNNNQFTRLDFSNSRDVRFETEMDAQFETGFFEGDLGAIFGGLTGQDAPFDLPIAAGLMPLLYQNGIWMEDVVAGVAVALPWRHSTELNWANYDITFFALFDQITSPAFENNNGVANAFGTAWFIEAYDGYIEADYAYMHDRVDSNRSYHNTAIAYTRRYFERISNSVRLINNYGQDRPSLDRTADGTILLLENSLVTSKATTFIPYANFFYGFRNPQSVARAAAAGGILRNTGILFETDNLTGYPTLDATGSNAYGGAFGINTFSSNFRRQFVLEFAALDTYGDSRFSTAAGPEYGFGGRYQQAITNWSLIRFDAMVGLRDGDSDLYGSRAEWRWKF